MPSIHDVFESINESRLDEATRRPTAKRRSGGSGAAAKSKVKTRRGSAEATFQNIEHTFGTALMDTMNNGFNRFFENGVEVYPEWDYYTWGGNYNEVTQKGTLEFGGTFLLDATDWELPDYMSGFYRVNTKCILRGQGEKGFDVTFTTTTEPEDGSDVGEKVPRMPNVPKLAVSGKWGDLENVAKVAGKKYVQSLQKVLKSYLPRIEGTLSDFRGYDEW